MAVKTLPPASASATPERLVDTSSPLEQLDRLNELVTMGTLPPGDWADRLNAVRESAVEIGLWDEDCEIQAKQIAQKATDQELDGLQRDVTAGRTYHWTDRLQEIRSHARAESVWTAGNDGTAHAIALCGMDANLREIGTAKDASSKEGRIDIARDHDRTAQCYGVHLFSDRIQGAARVRLAWDYRDEAVDQMTDAGRDLTRKDLPAAGYDVGRALQSGIDAHISLFQGARLMVTDKDVLPFVSPAYALGKHLVD